MCQESNQGLCTYQALSPSLVYIRSLCLLSFKYSVKLKQEWQAALSFPSGVLREMFVDSSL